MSRIHFGPIQISANIPVEQPPQESAPTQPKPAAPEFDSEKHALLEQFEKRKQQSSIPVPTSDAKIKQRLRKYGLPITLFGEGPADRRDRLRAEMAKRDWENETDDDDDEMEEIDYEQIEEEFYHPGGEDLLQIRQQIAAFSIPRAHVRITAQKALHKLPPQQQKKQKLAFYTTLKQFQFSSSQIADDRPLSSCLFSPNSKLLCTGSWSGICKIWDVNTFQHVHSLKGQKERISGISFHPGSTITQHPSLVNICTCGMDGKVYLHNFESEDPIGELNGHSLRVARCAFHPSGRFIATTSYDQTWRLWDVGTQQELLLQEGHSRPVYAVSFQNDGSLIATGGMDSTGRVWDLRSGKSVMVLQGHVKSILSLDWQCTGHVLASGSEDNSIRIWDIRSAKCSAVIPAHTNIVTNVKFWDAGVGALEESKEYKFRDYEELDIDDERECPWEVEKSMDRQLLDGSFLLSSSYDGTCKMFTEGDWKPVKVLKGEGKIMGCDLSNDGKNVAIASYDRTFKLFAKE